MLRSPIPLATLSLIVAWLGSAQTRAQVAPKEAARAPLPANSPDRAPSKAPDKALQGGLSWRCIGPFRGGRAATCTGLVGQRSVYYFGSCGGGVWKTLDGGRSWKNCSDGFFGGSIGAVAVSESDPNVIYVGGGEKTVRGNVSSGTGIWKSVDAGRTWNFSGLRESRHVPRIRIHPKNPDLVYAAVLGHLFGPNDERGVYRSKDGGKSWERVLHAGPNAGAIDLVLDPTNPRIIYAATWRVRRTPYSLESGGEGSALWKSKDGGDSWTELSKNKGFPKGTLGIMGVSVSRSRPDRVYAIVEHEKGGVFRSDDGGKTWKRQNDERKLRQRAWYYTRIYADPIDAAVVYVVNVRFWKSKDGGKSFSSISTPHGDNHDLWIDPRDPKRMIEVNDGGANVSEDGGRSWTRQDNQPTAQFYRVHTDDAFPYRIYGGQQDNSAIRIASRGDGRGIGLRDWEPTAGGESAHIAVDPRNPDLVYGGSYGGYLVRFNHRSRERRNINAWPENPMGWGAAKLRHRFQWNFPIFFSPHPPYSLYTASQFLLRSDDEGQSWQRISPDLTRNEKKMQGPSGGPITKDNTAVEYYCTIFAACESPREKGLLWCGSDDGLVHMSRDGGKTWKNVTPKGLPEWAMINSLDVHPFQDGGLYLAATRYKLDDDRPLLFKTLDYGATWKKITAGIPETHFTRVLRADPVRAGLLYAGTERGVYMSLDDGEHWHSLQGKLPIVPITDLAVKRGDLVAATQGRSYWILDDLTFVRQWKTGPMPATARLFRPEPVIRMGGGPGGRNRGQNPPNGAVLRYWLPKELTKGGSPLTLEIRDSKGALVRRFSSKAKKKNEKLPAKKGLNRFEWKLRYEGAKTIPEMILWGGGTGGPRVVPGIYDLRMTVLGEELGAKLEVKRDPRSKATREDMAAQLAFLLEVRDTLTKTHDCILAIRDTRSQIQKILTRLGKREGASELTELAKGIVKELDRIEKTLYQTKNRSRQDPLNFPIRLNNKLSALVSVVSTGDRRPTDQAEEVRATITKAIERELEAYRELREKRLATLEAALQQYGIPHVFQRPKGETRH